MNNFIKSVKTATTSSKENVIKNNIITQLSNSVKEIQLYDKGENLSGDIAEVGNNLCTIIEAMFLHGLKDSFSHRFRRALIDVDERPEPSFWAPLLVISHRQIIDQITKLPQITTEIGQCRSWVRITLNDTLLSSYLATMRQDTAALKPYYNTYAYVRDTELLEVAQRLIEGVEIVKVLTHPYNSSLLNTWPQSSLLLAGIWSPTLRSCPVSTCVDIAKSLKSTEAINPETCSLASAMSLTVEGLGITQKLNLTEDDTLAMILASDQSSLSSSIPQSDAAEGKSTDNESSSKSDTDKPLIETNIGNSLNLRSGWSFDDTQQTVENIDAAAITSETQNIGIEGAKSTEHSYNALIESYNMLGGAYIKTPDLREVWQRFEDKDLSIIEPESNSDLVDEENIVNAELSVEPLPLALQIGKIAREKGLDVQNYECAGCKHPLGISHKPKLCAFTGMYYCDNCMSEETIPIPARIIHNWDFKLYQVSQKAFNYIEEVKNLPTIDLKVINPYIYSAIEEMSRLQMYRNQLNFLRAYLFTCKTPIIEELQQQTSPREYLYEHIHQYSISDLLQILDGTLAQQLEKIVIFGKEHVFGCMLCSQKGFVCEICNKSKALYPFDVENVYRCEACSAVYHNGCLNSKKPCPKCERRKRREDMPLLGATIQ